MAVFAKRVSLLGTYIGVYTVCDMRLCARGLSYGLISHAIRTVGVVWDSGRGVSARWGRGLLD